MENQLKTLKIQEENYSKIEEKMKVFQREKEDQIMKTISFEREMEGVKNLIENLKENLQKKEVEIKFLNENLNEKINENKFLNFNLKKVNQEK
jgi:hypothetical protein